MKKIGIIMRCRRARPASGVAEDQLQLVAGPPISSATTFEDVKVWGSIWEVRETYWGMFCLHGPSEIGHWK